MVLSGPDGEVWGRFWVTEAPAPGGTGAVPAEVLDTYVGLPDGVEDLADTMTRRETGEYALTISLPGSGECVAVPVATDVDGRTVTIVVRDRHRRAPRTGRTPRTSSHCPTARRPSRR